MRRRVRRSAKKASQVSWGWALDESEILLVAGAEGVCVGVDEVEAWRVACIVVVIAAVVVIRLRPLRRVRTHVDNDAVPAIDNGAAMPGGKRFAKAPAGHNALLESIAMSCLWREYVCRGGRCG